MTDRSPSTPQPAGAPFAAMLRGALLPATAAGALAVVGVVLWRGGPESLVGGVVGLLVAVGFFASGMFLMSRLVRSASAHAFFAVAMAVYLGQVLALLVVILVFRDADWVDGPSLGWVAFVVTIAWQVFAMRALRRARVPVYDPAPDAVPAAPEDGR